MGEYARPSAVEGSPVRPFEELDQATVEVPNGRLEEPGNAAR